MEGSQHNTMDVNYFGPNPQMGFWYMGALRAAEEMARAMKDKEFAKKCRSLFERGSAWMDANLFNGEYYEHKITDPETFEFLPEGSDKVPAFQLGKGCLVDQLVGLIMTSARATFSIFSMCGSTMLPLMILTVLNCLASFLHSTGSGSISLT